MAREHDIQRRIAGFDLSLFDHIESQTTVGDKRALLALHGTVRGGGPFTYREIGSHLRGSLQPYVVDPACERIVSIDPRPLCQPDERLADGTLFRYADSSTERMLKNAFARARG